MRHCQVCSCSEPLPPYHSKYCAKHSHIARRLANQANRKDAWARYRNDLKKWEERGRAAGEPKPRSPALDYWESVNAYRAYHRDYARRRRAPARVARVLAA